MTRKSKWVSPFESLNKTRFPTDDAVFSEETARVGNGNPFLILDADKISPSTPPQSPINKKPMISVVVGAANGRKIRAWASPEERICYPRLAEKNIQQ